MLITVVLGSLTFYKIISVGVVVLAMCKVLWELTAAFAHRRIRPPLVPLWLGTLRTSMCAWRVGAEAAFGVYVTAIDAYILWSLVDQAGTEIGTILEQADHDIPRTEARDEVHRSRFNAMAAPVSAVTYLSFLAGFVVLLLVQRHGVGKVMMFIALATANDTSGRMAGIISDRYPLAPSASLKKSQGRLMDSLIAAIATGADCVWTIGGSWWTGATLDTCTVIAPALGDLEGSLFKRDLESRGMGTFLPGHSGIMGRLDSILMTTPLVYAFIPLVRQERMPHPSLSTNPTLPSPGARGTRT